MLRKDVLSDHFREEDSITLALVHRLEDPNSLRHFALRHIIREKCAISGKKVALRHEVEVLGSIKLFHPLHSHA
jgi:hypothetical protein